MNESEPSMRCRENVHSVKTTGSLALEDKYTNLKVNFWRLVRVFNKTSKSECFSMFLSVSY
jgi:hypothetical protein